jgi:hypothetical protein
MLSVPPLIDPVFVKVRVLRFRTLPVALAEKPAVAKTAVSAVPLVESQGVAAVEPLQLFEVMSHVAPDDPAQVKLAAQADPLITKQMPIAANKVENKTIRFARANAMRNLPPKE